MNTERLRLVAELWATLNTEERQAFARQCGGGEAAPAMQPSGAANLGGILAQDRSHSVAGPRRAPLPPGSGQRTRRVPVVDYDLDLFASPAYRRLAQDTRLVHVYVASCQGTAQIYEATRTVVYKAGTHAGADVATRIATLNTTAYASWRKAGQGLVEEAGYTSWRAEQLPVEIPRTACSPVEPRGTSLAVHLPVVIAAEEFDIAVTQALLPVSLARLGQEPRIALSLLSMGCDPDMLQRYTARVGEAGHKRAADLVRLKPRGDADALASMVEGLVATLVHDHL